MESFFTEFASALAVAAADLACAGDDDGFAVIVFAVGTCAELSRSIMEAVEEDEVFGILGGGNGSGKEASKH